MQKKFVDDSKLYQAKLNNETKRGIPNNLSPTEQMKLQMLKQNATPGRVKQIQFNEKKREIKILTEQIRQLDSYLKTVQMSKEFAQNQQQKQEPVKQYGSILKQSSQQQTKNLQQRLQDPQIKQKLQQQILAQYNNIQEQMKQEKTPTPKVNVQNEDSQNRTTSYLKQLQNKSTNKTNNHYIR